MMSLRVLSPHPHSCDPQSPYPCTPSTTCSSPPIPQPSYFASNQQQTQTTTTTPPGSSVHSSHLHTQTLLRDSSPLSQLARAFRSTRARQTSAEGGGTTFASEILPLPGTPTPSQIEDGCCYTEDRSNDDEGSIGIMMDMDMHSNASVTSSPVVPVSVRSPSMSTISGTPDRLRHHHTPRGRSDAAGISEHGTMKTHPSAQSIPIIFAARAVSKSTTGQSNLGRHMKENSGESMSSMSRASDRMDDDIGTEENRGSVGSGVGLGLAILQDPIEIRETTRTPRGSIAPGHAHYHTQAPKHADSAMHHFGQNEVQEDETLLLAPRQERADSWTPSLASMEYSSGSSVHSAVTMPNTPAHDAFLGLSDAASALGSPLQSQTRDRTATVASEFSVSAYNYTPLMEQGPLVSSWAANTIIENALPPVPTIAENKHRETRKRTVSVAAIKTKQSALQSTDEEKQTKKRRRAATLATRPEEAQQRMEQVRPQTSPSQGTKTRFVEGFVTMKKRPVGALNAQTDPSATPTRLPSRPSTANELRMSPLTFLKPLPALPTPRTSQTAGKKPSLLSIETSPKRPVHSRPSTASPAARSFGLVSIPSPSRPNGSQTHLRNRDSIGSVGEVKIDKLGRSRAVSVSSQASGYATPQQGSSWPPRYITLAIDQESFRKVAPVLELQEELARSSGSFLPNSAERSHLLRYLPVYPEHTYPFHHSAMEGCPVLRKLCVEGQEDKDFMHKQSLLPIKNEGIYAVKGSSAKGEYNWRFEYRVEDRLNLIGKPIPGEKNLTPLSFVCDADVLNLANARKRKGMDLVYRSLTSKLEALRVGDLPSSDAGVGF